MKSEKTESQNQMVLGWHFCFTPPLIPHLDRLKDLRVSPYFRLKAPACTWHDLKTGSVRRRDIIATCTFVEHAVHVSAKFKSLAAHAIPFPSWLGSHGTSPIVLLMRGATPPSKPSSQAF